MASDLVIKVKGDTKDAAAKLKELGANVEVVEAKTKKATQAQSVWDKTIQKGSDDSIKKLVALGAQYASVAGAAKLAYGFIKSSVEEALKVNEEAAKTLQGIDGAWKEIKANLGQALLDTVTPALDSLYARLVSISEWTNTQTKGNSISKLVQNAAKKKTTVDLSGYSAEELDLARTLISTNARFGDSGYGYLDKAWQMVDEAYQRAISTPAPTPAPTAPPAPNTPDYFAWMAKRADLLARGEAVSDLYATGGGMTPEEWWAKYNAEHLAPRASNGGFYETQYTAQARPGQQIIEDEFKAVHEAEARAEASRKKAEEAARKSEALISKYGSDGTLAKSLDAWENYYSTITSYAQKAFGTMASLMDTLYNEQIYQIKNSTMAEEEKAEKIDELKRKQFRSNQANSIAQAAIDTASAVMNIWAQNAANPVYAGILTGLATATGAAQIGAISAQQYHAFAEGGIVSRPIHAMIGEGAEKEAILPLSKLRDFISTEASAGTINITVNVADGSGGKDIAQDVYYAIERAQRTGLLPRWKYA